MHTEIGQESGLFRR